ncbi:MAG: HNH endonuclease [Chloroflexi bacterium]|nr:HNH endonuclease [Chloroflexota bacterium]
MPHRLYAEVARRARHRCEYCRAPEAVFNLEFEVEHVVPQARGGTGQLDNLALACRSCNLRKGVVQRARDPETGQLVPLFNPRTDVWGEHLQINLETFEIEGLTPTGRAVVQRLGMNRRPALQARRLWVARLLLRF